MNWSWVQSCQTIVANQENPSGRSISIQGVIPATSVSVTDIGSILHGTRRFPSYLSSNVYKCFPLLYAHRMGPKKGDSVPGELCQTKKDRVFCNYFLLAEIGSSFSSRHTTKLVSTSKAELKGVPVASITKQGHCSKASTFQKNFIKKIFDHSSNYREEVQAITSRFK